MDNRFTLKDLFLFGLLVLMIGMVGLAMIQYDRQWETLKKIQSQGTQQTAELIKISGELAKLRQTIGKGGIAVGPSTQSSDATATLDPKTDPFVKIHAAQTNADFALGDWLINNTGAKLSKITPLLSSDVYANFVQSRVVEPLAIRDDDTLEWRPHLATSWTIEDNSAAWNAAVDALVKSGKSLDDAKKDPSLPIAVRIRFKLRPNVTFSDGHPFTADDLVFSFDWVCNEAVDAPRPRAYIKENIASVEKVSDLEVVYNFKRPYFEAFSLAAGMDILPKHFISKYSPKDFNESVGLLLGTGQYRLEDPTAWRPGKTMLLVRNERYWGEPGTFSRILINEVENDAAELSMFRNGELDIFGAQPEQYQTLKDEPEINEKANRFEYSSINGGYSYVAWNQLRTGKPTVFADKRVRQALTMLIDRERMAKAIFLGYANVTSGPFNPQSKQNAPDIKPWPFDAKRARALLKEAGFEDRNGDGVLEGPDGTPFKFSLIYGNSNPISQKIALLVKDGLAQAGIVMELEPTDWPIMLQKLDKKDFDAITLGWSGGAEGDIFQMFHSSQSINNGDNYMSYKNPKLDELMVKARETVKEDERMPLWQECHRMLNDDQPYTFLMTRKSLVFIDKRIKNVALTKTGLNFTSVDTAPIPWYVPAALQKHTTN